MGLICCYMANYLIFLLCRVEFATLLQIALIEIM